MTTLASTLALVAPPLHAGPSGEMRRFIAGIRVVTALLCTVLLIASEAHISVWAISILLAYCLWSGWVLWVEASGRSHHTALWPYWIDVAWACVTMKLLPVGTMMLIITLVHPVVVVLKMETALF